MSEKEQPGFEEALKKLETIVQQLSNEDIPLEKSVELYEEGLKLSKICTETLENAALKIEQIDERNGHNKKEN